MGMDSYAVARALRYMPELGRPVLAAITGWDGPEDRLGTKQDGFDGHLTKPVDVSTIELLLTTIPVGCMGDEGGPPRVENRHNLDTPRPLGSPNRERWVVVALK